MSEVERKSVKKRTGRGGWLFLALVLLLYGISASVDRTLTQKAVDEFIHLAHQMAPVLVWVFILIFTSNLLLSPKRIEKYLGRHSGLMGWLITLVAGILSTGPVYAWYSMLRELKQRGMKTSLMVAFLYSRAIKIHLLPLMIHYFGITYSLLLGFYLICFAVVSGVAMQALEGKLWAFD